MPPNETPRHSQPDDVQHEGTGQVQHWLLVTLERLLAIEAVDTETALDQASDLIVNALKADKVDVFLYQPEIHSLIALGTSHTPMGQKQQELGLDRLPLANGGRSVLTYQSRLPYRNGRVEEDLEELPGITKDLGIRSMICVPMYVAGELRGLVQVDSARHDAFSEYDLRFMEAVAGWVGTITHRAELIEKIRHDAQEEARRTVAEELVTIIAHDLGNYLTPLMGRLELIRRRADREGRQKDVSDAQNMALVLDRLSGLIADLMDVGRLEQGIFSLEPQVVDIVSLVQDTASALSTPTCLAAVTSSEKVVTMADPRRLRQALENLLSNAIKHSPDGASVTVEVTTRKHKDGETVEIRVRDQGPGIPPAVLPRLFNRFSAGPGSTGLGLGLYLARGIAIAHGGTITVENTPGAAGATFCLSIPHVLSE